MGVDPPVAAAARGGARVALQPCRLRVGERGAVSRVARLDLFRWSRRPRNRCASNGLENGGALAGVLEGGSCPHWSCSGGMQPLQGRLLPYVGSFKKNAPTWAPPICSAPPPSSPVQPRPGPFPRPPPRPPLRATSPPLPAQLLTCLSPPGRPPRRQPPRPGPSVRQRPLTRGGEKGGRTLASFFGRGGCWGGGSHVPLAAPDWLHWRRRRLIL